MILYPNGFDPPPVRFPALVLRSTAALTRSDLIADSCQAIAVFIVPMKPPCDVDRWRNPPLP
jgi:hypothetical protein